MTTTRYVCLALAPFAILGGIFWDRIAPYLQRRPAPVGADETYGPQLVEMKHEERELEAIAEEYELDLLTQRDIAEEVLALRRNVNELVDHCLRDRLGGLEAWLDEWAEGWEQPAVELPTFGAVHALIEDTAEWELVSV